MNSLLLENDCYNNLFIEQMVSAEFSTESTLRHFIAFENALTRALVKSGAVEVSVGRAASERMKTFSADITAIRQATLADGMPAPEFVRQLKAHVGPELGSAVHVGATSQDLIDTALVLALREINRTFSARLVPLVTALRKLAAVHGGKPLMGRTRMQAAVLITVADRVKTWILPLEEHLHRLDQLRPRLERLQFGGPVGDRALPDNKGDEVAALLAREFGLGNPQKAWHAMRDALAEYANWLSLVTGSLGKMGQDLCLMAQQGIDEVVFSGGGTSSAMAHKQNPVLAETLVSFARFNAVQLSGMHHALVHEQERSGAAWTLEWMILPAMVNTTGKSLELALALVGQIEQIGKVQPD